VKLSNRLTWVPMTVATAVLVSVLVFLYARTQHQGESDYFENVSLLRHFKQLDAQWELDVLKSRIGLNAHYDPLADSSVELSALLAKFESDLGIQPHDAAATLAQGSAALRRVVGEKALLIERFKSTNAVLRNSLAFLPTAEQDVQRAIGRSRTGVHSAAKPLSESVNRLLLASMLYSQSASDDRRSEIQSELNRLDAYKRLVAADIREAVDIFEAHVRTILREQGTVNGLLGGIAEVPTAARVDDIHNALSGEQQRAAAQNQRYRGYLLAFSAALSSASRSERANCGRRKGNWSPRRGRPAWPRLPSTCCTTWAMCSTASTSRPGWSSQGFAPPRSRG
jgi:two-component system NtrC family sensor kinase